MRSTLIIEESSKIESLVDGEQKKTIELNNRYNFNLQFKFYLSKNIFYILIRLLYLYIIYLRIYLFVFNLFIKYYKNLHKFIFFKKNIYETRFNKY